MGAVDVVIIVIVSSLSMLVSEMISWLFVYRTDRYKKSVERVKHLVPLYENAKARGAAKETEKYKGELKQLSSETSGSSIKSFLFLAVVQWLTFTVLSRWYEGVVVAKLPFVPFSLVQGMSHRNIIGNDFTETSFLLIFILTTMLRSVLQKVLGFEAPKNPVVNTWGMSDEK